jgi:uncharacterized protein (UPF0335 family)
MTINNLPNPLSIATPEVRQIIERVLQLEKDRLDRKKNSPINDDILKIIKEIIK